MSQYEILARWLVDGKARLPLRPDLSDLSRKFDEPAHHARGQSGEMPDTTWELPMCRLHDGVPSDSLPPEKE